MISQMVLVFVFLIGTFPVFPRQVENNYVAWKGRVIDKNGKPVVRAKVWVELTVPVDDCHGSVAVTNENGVFQIPWRSSPASQQAVLYVATGLPEDAIAPIDFPLLNILKNNPAYAGRPLFIRHSDQGIQLGDVQEQVRYGLVSLHLPEAVLEGLSLESLLCSGLWLRVRNLGGDIVSEELCISSKSIAKLTSAVAMALPVGSWKVEVAFGSRPDAWRALDRPLIVNDSGEPLTVELSLIDGHQPRKVQAKSRYTRETAKEKLLSTGVDYSPSAFLEKVAADNVEAVELFLTAGMDANTRRNDGNTALMLATTNGYAEIVSVLLDHGADVDARNGMSRGETALLLASFSRYTGIVKALIDHGADVNAKLDDGWTPLMLAAAGRIDIVRLLISAGADVNARSEDGMTALIQAKTSREVVELLKRAGARQ